MSGGKPQADGARYCKKGEPKKISIGNYLQRIFQLFRILSADQRSCRDRLKAAAYFTNN